MMASILIGGLLGFAGCIALLCAIAGPFFAAVLAPREQADVVGQSLADLQKLRGPGQ